MFTYAIGMGVFCPLTRGQLRSLEKFTPRADQDILREVQDKLQTVDKFDLNQIKGSLADGLVHLTRPVATVLGKEQVQWLVESVKGVLGVENQIVADADVSAQVTTALLMDDRTMLIDIDVQCENGVVTLSGKVDSEAAKTIVVEVAAAQPGVMQINNHLTVE